MCSGVWGKSPRPIYLYGHSGGGQFVHRYMMFGRAERIVRAVAANSGWYMMPDPDTRFPYGLLGTPYDSAALRNYLATPMIVLLGAVDTRVTKSLRQSKRAMQQAPIDWRVVGRFSTPAGALRPSYSAVRLAIRNGARCRAFEPQDGARRGDNFVPLSRERVMDDAPARHRADRDIRDIVFSVLVEKVVPR